jgi:pimeloyl-ACP methyl ester carboxylesterase
MSDLRQPKSTNVRAAHAPWTLRLALATASAVAPSLAAAAAERLFLTPPRRHRARPGREAAGSGETFQVRFGSERLQAWRYGEGPSILLVHGWGGRSEQMARFVPPLVSAGCSVVAFDAPAHGRSSGAIASVPHFADALAEVATRVDARGAVGHSIGAAGLGWALGGGLRLDAAVLVGPPRSPAAFFQRFCDALALTPSVGRAARARLERRFGAPLEAFDLPARVGRSATPFLVLHDRDDREVPWTDGAAIARAHRGGSLLRTEGLGHRRILADPEVVAAAAAFLRSHLARCGCGRLAVADASSALRCAGCALERELFERYERRAPRPGAR